MKTKGTTIHLALTVFWALLLIPTIIWWRDSILWISIMSVYAIVSTHWSGYQAARAEENN